VATQDVNLNAGNNVTLTTEQATHDETHYKKNKQSGFSASSTSIGYGSSKLTNTNDSQQVTNVGSTVGSVEGNVNIKSGKDVQVTGSDLIAGQDINITGRNVTLDAAYDTYANQQTMKYKQSGITLGVSAPVITAIQSAQDQVKRSSEVKDWVIGDVTQLISKRSPYSPVGRQ
jgi:filamentous hemagglutinin